jgi:hypothetical protein
MAAETQYTANTGMVTISTANSNLDGTGTLGTVLTAASNGTLVKTVTIKAQTNTTQGMIRLFVYDGTNTRLVAEIEVPAVTKSSTDESFEKYLDLDLSLKSSHVLKASTQNAETFNVIAEGLDWAYYGSGVRPESTNYTANTGLGLISTANSNLDGSGTLVTILTAGASGSGWKGCRVDSITIKGIVNTTHGMVRLFVEDSGGSNTKLLTEVEVPAVTKSSTARSFVHQINFNRGFEIQAGYKIRASTQNAESFTIMIDANDWKYPA